MGIQQKVMDYVKSNEGKVLSVVTIATALDLTKNQTYNALVWLTRKDSGVKKLSPGENGTWQYSAEVITPPNPCNEAKPMEKVPENIDIFFNDFVQKMSDSLVDRIKVEVAKRLEVITDDIAIQMAVDIEEKAREMTGNLVNDLFERISKSSEVAVKDEIPAEVEQQEKIRKPRIGICNLLPAQEQVLSQKYSAHFNITFWNDATGSSVSQLRKMSIGCEKVFWHAAHSNHSSFNVMRDSGANYETVPGGMSSLVRSIDNFLAQIA